MAHRTSMTLLSFELLTISCFLVCLIEPLQSDAQGSHWTSRKSYKPSNFPSGFLNSPEESVLIRSSLRASNYDRQAQNAPNARMIENGYVAKEDKPNQAHYLPKETNHGYEVSERYIKHLKHQFEIDPDYQEWKQHMDSSNEEEIMEKMNVLDRILSDDSNEHIELKNSIDSDIISDTIISEETKRVVRQVRKKEPGFFWTLARLTFEMINDTKSAIKQISNIVSSNFEPDTTTQRTTTGRTSMNDQIKMPSSELNLNVTTTTTTTTEAPFKFSRNGVQSLIRRNLKGLIRLFNIEWQDAVNQSGISTKEFRKDLGKQIGMYLQ